MFKYYLNNWIQLAQIKLAIFGSFGVFSIWICETIKYFFFLLPIYKEGNSEHMTLDRLVFKEKYQRAKNSVVCGVL